MNDNVIYRAKFQANVIALVTGFIFMIASVIFLIADVDCIIYFSGNDGQGVALFTFLVILFLVPAVCFLCSKKIASKCFLALENGQIQGQVKTFFGQKALQIPLDHMDNVMVSHGLMDKLRGGKTLLISSNRGLIKFHYVQNADEFARVAMEKIEEVKKKTFHNPAPVPAAAPAQPTGNDTMEKLDSLKKMLENGLITQEEFEVKRKELLEKL